ncbi:hypothetical protein HDU85_002620 [Gaertneriomyces sp. JEL0708]|nr:hypothetical protein HDU85_002620 [Gaertneriomyces sp. JEL0708]
MAELISTSPPYPVLRTGRFYQCCATFHPDLEKPSPLESNISDLPSPLPSGPLRVTEETKGWWDRLRRRVASGHPLACLLVDYNPATGIGVIFLATSRHQTHQHRFIGVGSNYGFSAFVETAHPMPFQLRTYLNFTHPLRVRLHVVKEATLNVLRQLPSPLDSTDPPPTVGMREFSTQVPEALDVTAAGMEVFWRCHQEYHRARRAGQAPPDFPEGGGGPSGGSGARDWGSGGTGGSGVTDRGSGGTGGRGAGDRAEGDRSGGEKSSSGKGTGLVESSAGGQGDGARIGPFLLGTDLPAVWEDVDVDYPVSDEENDDEELPMWEDHRLLGEVLLWDGRYDAGVVEMDTQDVVFEVRNALTANSHG